MADGSAQRDLFGDVDAELDRREQATRVQAEFDARTQTNPDGTPVVWVATHDTVSARRGQTVPGWRCWLCGDVEGNAYALDLRHGLHPNAPGVLDRVTCTAQDLAAARRIDPHSEASR